MKVGDHEVAITLIAAPDAPATLQTLLGHRATARTAEGKPYVVDGSLHFNLSHSGDYALIAVTPHAPVGVDIQQHRQRTRWRAIAERFFAPHEAASLQNDADFYRLWVIKEAVLKALGTGLHGWMAATPYETCDVAMIDAPAGYSAAVAIVR